MNNMFFQDRQNSLANVKKTANAIKNFNKRLTKLAYSNRTVDFVQTLLLSGRSAMALGQYS